MRRKSIIAAALVLTPGLILDTSASEPQTATRTTAVETVVKTDIDTTWNELVDELEGRGFQINALVKTDRTIKASFQTGVPSHYVDCGEISVNSKHAQFGGRNYNFLAANSVRYLVADEIANELVDVERRTSLNVLASINLTPMGQGTMVRVDADYIMRFRTREFGKNVKTRKLDDTMNFNSSGSASKQESIRQGATSKSVTIECRANGAFERKIVSVLGNPG
jgi:hypothetical protein